MKRSFRNSLILITALLLLMSACVLPQQSAGQTSPTANSGIDLWTAPPETEAPVSVSAEIQEPSSLPLAQDPATAAPAAETSVFTAPSPAPTDSPAPTPAIDEDGVYTSKDDVALYLHTYGHLPSNFITKKEAQALGWPGGDLRPYAPGKCIGGDYFGNYEKLLPTKRGRSYYECDIDTLNRRSRGAKRIVFSDDGLIYYTDDHFETFTLLYGGE